ncbi:M48 family metalloprotease [Waterburya agarophytonicola K14]|uniref:M48 family metalloprotease n=1 Tax=Waterburya agarophytonicola KI4 TaxID=2874699 RepID=A0A964BMY8_9CYAN|nr:M48 family metallopeptidase [Waterburya agarophytonicola]MCC0176004.1 M48 family metalloprotease [Waterburya agarophytonicola KI4]
MENIYPASPIDVPPNLRKPRKSYKQRAILAMVGLSLFVTLYFTLTSWFIWTAYRLFTTPNVEFEGMFIGVLSSFLAVFMVKPLLRVRHSSESKDIEITAKDEPRLFEFIYRLADEAQAPRPHRVFLSPRVNAAVFYDVSILNLFFTSKKNLEIGLGLVNILTLGEFKAVLAHEFGHFAQRSMAVGRWVYIAQQIASHIIHERDALDKFLRVLSRVDIRIAWIGWLLSLIVWSIRSLLETAFRWLLLAQRALSREMEFQADLVAVSLTGSDALVHALHRIHAADDAWDRTLSFASSEMRNNRLVTDLFTIQNHSINKMREILNDQEYGQAPKLPDLEPENHRVFQAAIAESPRMWSTHPSNVDRENNAKRIYVANACDNRSTWDLFANSKQIRLKMTKNLLDGASPSNDAKSVNIQDSLEQFDHQYSRLYLNPLYQGNYLGRSIVGHAASTPELYESSHKNRNLEQDLASLYPESLVDDLEKLRVLESEKASLRALQEGYVKAPEGVIRHRGKTISRLDLPSTIAQVNVELRAVKERILFHDRLCRTTHRRIAVKMGRGWEQYLVGLLEILHYTDHTEANLRDALGYLDNVVGVITADGNVSGKELQRLLVAATEVYQVLALVYEQSSLVKIDANLSQAFDNLTWGEILGSFELVSPDRQNINQWMNIIHNWFGVTINALSALKLEALEQLLKAEEMLSNAYRQSETLETAPDPSQTPEQYSVLLPGKERKRQTRLGWWDRFQTADGLVPQILRLVVAGTIIASVPIAVATLSQ